MLPKGKKKKVWCDWKAKYMKLEMPTENSRPSSLYVRLNFSARLRSSKGKKKKRLSKIWLTSMLLPKNKLAYSFLLLNQSTNLLKDLTEIFQTSKSCSNKKHFHNYLTTLKIHWYFSLGNQLMSDIAIAWILIKLILTYIAF